jgi:hypothetical protein
VQEAAIIWTRIWTQQWWWWKYVVELVVICSGDEEFMVAAEVDVAGGFMIGEGTKFCGCGVTNVTRTRKSKDSRH